MDYSKKLRQLTAILAAVFMVVAGTLVFAAPEPNGDSGQIAIIVTKMLEQGHYLKKPIDDDASKQFLRFYLDALDYNHLVFFQSDVDEFTKKYGDQLDDETKKGNVKPGYEIFARFLQRTEQRVAYAKSILNDKWTFASQESIITDRRELAWPANEAEAKKLWKLWLKHEILQEKLGNQKPEEIINILSRRYDRMLRAANEWDREGILEIYLTALSHVYDPHTDYLAPSDLENFSISMKLSLFGIGAVLSSEDGYCKIMSVVPGGPAALDKRLKVNDRVVGVAQGDGEFVDVVDMKLQKVVDQIRGKKGTTVRLLVIPADAPDPSTRVEIKLVRDEIKLTEQEAKAKIIEYTDPDGKVHKLGYIDLPSFYADMQQTATSKSTTRDVRKLLEHLKKQNIEGLVLDLRRNGGGSLQEAISLTGLFIKEGPVVQVKDAQGRIQVGRDTDSAVAYDGPMIVLTTHVSASASEIFAGAIQDYGRAVVVGEKSTFGKGTVQSMLEVGRYAQPQDGKQPSWGALKLTIQKFYRISGGSTQHRGVIPDIQLPSVLDYRKVAETALKNPLPYDEVAKVKYEEANQVATYVPQLQKLVAARTSHDPEFKYVMEDIERIKEQEKDKSISLNEAKRLAEKKADTERSEARKKERQAREKATQYKITEVTLGGLAGEAASTPAFTKNVMDAAAQAGGEQKPAEPEADPVFDEAVRIISDLVRLVGIAAR